MYKITSSRPNWKTSNTQAKVMKKKSRVGNNLRIYVQFSVRIKI